MERSNCKSEVEEPLSNVSRSDPKQRPQPPSKVQQSSPPVSDFRRSASQYCAIAATSLLTLVYGISIGFSTILIPELYKKDSEIQVTLEELTWISSMNYFAIPIGAVASGFVSQRLGRRNSLAAATVPYFVAWTLLNRVGTGAQAILIAFALLGLTGGLVEAPLIIYVTETCEPKLRGSVAASVSFTIALGIFMQILVGSRLQWRTLAMVNAAVPVVALLVLSQVPETPHWLAGRGRLGAAQKSLCWLRGWTKPDQVQQEYESILASVSKSKRPSQKPSLKLLLKKYLRRQACMPFAVITFAFLIACFNGSVAIISFAVLLFGELNSPIDKHSSAIVLGAMQVLASILLIFLLPKTGKRKPTFASLAVAGTAMLLVAVYALLKQKGILLPDNSYTWLPSSMLVLSIFAVQMGIRTIPWAMAGELFPDDVRGLAAGVVGATCNLYAAVASKIFLYQLQWMTLACSFFFFAAVNYFGLVVLYFVLPETEGKPLHELGDHFTSKKKLEERRMLELSTVNPLMSPAEEA